MSEYLPLSHSEDKCTSCGSEALPDDDLRALQIHEREGIDTGEQLARWVRRRYGAGERGARMLPTVCDWAELLDWGSPYFLDANAPSAASASSVLSAFGIATGSAIHCNINPSHTAISTEVIAARLLGAAIPTSSICLVATLTPDSRTAAYPAANRSRSSSDLNAGAYDSTHACTDDLRSAKESIAARKIAAS